MSEPTSYPTWRYWQDGRRALVPTPEEYADLPPGHSDRPDGPWEGPAAASSAAAPPAGHDSRARAQALREAGRSRKAIAEALGVTEYTVRRWLEDP